MPEGHANPAPRRAAAAIAIVAAAWLCYAATKHEFASHFVSSANSGNWERAARIEPDNPDIWYRLGRSRQLDFDHTDFPLAVSYFQKAIQLNPSSPYYKLDLAGTFEMEGNGEEADRYFRAAQQSYPISAEVAWKYGNFLLRQQRLSEAYAEIHRAVAVDPKLIPLAISRVWRSNPDVHVLLEQVLPDTVQADTDALAFLSDEKEPVAALAVWNRLIAKNAHPEWKAVFALTDLLIAQELFEDAGTVWRQAVAKDENAARGYSDHSLIFDGGFEQDISGGGFGWQQIDVPGAEFDFDSDIKHSGDRAARVIFDGTQNLSYESLFQYVLVSPRTHYRFRGYLRTDQISTDSGVRFEITDPKDPQHLTVLTPNENGTEPWTLEETDFTSGPKTHLLLVRLVRRPSQRLDNKISGTAWVDDVSLIPFTVQSKQASPGGESASSLGTR
jgi:tetratricopeptide (TPR) repeat protein